MIYKFISVYFMMLSSAFSVEIGKVDFYGESAIQYREDRLRERVNEDETSVTNLSIVAEKKIDKEKLFRLEILGEESRVTNEFNLTIGELFYKQELSFDDYSYLDFNYQVGFMKLKYGLLNPVDGNFARLPNFYQFLYGLPRGIDVGLAIEKKITEKWSIGGGGYFGQTVRDSDGFQAQSVNLPFNLYMSYEPFRWLSVNAHYYNREFENTPQISGLGFDFKTDFKIESFDLYLNGEIWSINSLTGLNDTRAQVFLFNPKVKYKSVYVESFLTSEEWNSSDSPGSVNEQYNSHRLGVRFSEYFVFETEYLSITNSELDLDKEDAFQARVYFNWVM